MPNDADYSRFLIHRTLRHHGLATGAEIAYLRRSPTKTSVLAALKEIVDAFGEDILEPSGNLDREALAKIIFDDTENKFVLEAILHPKVIVREQEMYLSISASNPSAIVIVDAALLIESGNYKNVDKVVVVQSREEQQIQRILSRGFQTYDQAIARIKNQMSFEEKSKYADYILDNQSQVEDLRLKVQEMYAKLLDIQ